MLSSAAAGGNSPSAPVPSAPSASPSAASYRLTPSQTIKNGSASASGATSKTATASARRRTKDQTPKPTTTTTAVAVAVAAVHDNKKPARRRRRGGGTNTKGSGGGPAPSEAVEGLPASSSAATLPTEDATQQKLPSATTKSSKKRPPKKRQPKTTSQQQKPPNRKAAAASAKYPWRRRIPAGSVDPITLESLKSLPYPPFALVATAPYDPVPVWPLPEEEEDEGKDKNREDATGGRKEPPETEQQRHERILRQQWGDKLQVSSETAATTTAASAADAISTGDAAAPNLSWSTRHLHLYDGRALAYYCVSQLQFIDPLNRRDLTRPELVNLDRYLRRHGFDHLNVTEAYDAKGITVSTAGAIGNTAAGRAAILQQEARVLLNALFGGTSVTAAASSAAASSSSRPAAAASLASQYRAHEESQQLQRQRHGPSATTTASTPNDYYDDDTAAAAVGIWDDGEGYLVIDDDQNPGLRGSAPAFVPHALRQQQNQQVRDRRVDFPSLAETAPLPTVSATATANSTAPSSGTSAPPKPLPPSATLSKIATAVQKTDPDEQQRQWEAREEARRKAVLSTMTFGSNLAAAWEAQVGPPPPFPTTIVTKSDAPPMVSESLLQRNQALASALGVAPATLRQPGSGSQAGWARPTSVPTELDEFGRELLCNYPQALIAQAKERTGLLLKLEKKWLKFLSDDGAPSLPLNPMDRPSREFVHQYSDYWKLQTESYDAEPRRYIHCTKTLETCAPHPLLSDVAHNWRDARPAIVGPLPSEPAASRGREIPAAPPRTPLPLKPRGGSRERSSAASGVATGLPIRGTPTRPSQQVAHDAPNSRVESILSDRERPKLQLAQRSLPLELPPYQPPIQHGAFDVSEELQRRKERMEEQARQEEERIRKQRQVLEAAFASDDEEGSADGSDDSSDWEEQEALFTGSDEGS